MEKHSGNILLSPRITEKGAYMAESGVYVFNVAKDANKLEVAHAIRELYKVVPRAVRMAAVPRKQVVTRNTNKKGMTAGGKKAYVYLKKGDSIEIA